MRKALSRITRDDRGLTTVEYGVCTVAAAGLGGVLIKLLTSDSAKDLIWTVLRSAVSMFAG